MLDNSTINLTFSASTDTLFCSQRSYMETKGWDVFRSLPPEQDSSSEAVDKWLGTTVKVLKVVAYILTFCVVLVCGVVTKGITLFMTSQIKPDRSVKYCR